jgi:hypothetical protein
VSRHDRPESGESPAEGTTRLLSAASAWRKILLRFFREPGGLLSAPSYAPVYPTRRIGATQDIELYRAILGLTLPWMVASVELDVKGQQVVVQMDAGPGPEVRDNGGPVRR